MTFIQQIPTKLPTELPTELPAKLPKLSVYLWCPVSYFIFFIHLTSICSQTAFLIYLSITSCFLAIKIYLKQ